MKLLKCRTDHGIFLVAAPDDEGVLRFPSDFSHPFLYGLHIQIVPLMPVEPQLTNVARQGLGFDFGPFLQIFEDFSDQLSLTPDAQTTLFVGRLAHPEFRAPKTWLSLPDILRSMGKDRRRVAYMRALQVLTGALTLETKAFDIEEVAKHLIPDAPEGSGHN
jgi:hypothetical protein